MGAVIDDDTRGTGGLKMPVLLGNTVGRAGTDSATDAIPEASSELADVVLGSGTGRALKMLFFFTNVFSAAAPGILNAPTEVGPVETDVVFLATSIASPSGVVELRLDHSSVGFRGGARRAFPA